MLLQANSKADDKATSPPQDSADAQDSTQAKQAGHQLVKGKLADSYALQHRLEYEQERVRRLEARLEDAKHASEYHRLVRAGHAAHPTTGYHTFAAQPIRMTVK